MRLAVRGIEPGEIDALLHFNAQMYGPDSYQATRRYIDWLYLKNPCSRGLADCVVALSGKDIVGSVHRMRLPCLDGDKTLSLASFQNHVVAPELRGGAGVMLLQRAVRGEAATLSPGVHGRLRDVYRRLGYVEVPSFWLMKISSPVAAATQLARRTLLSRFSTAPLRLNPPSRSNLPSSVELTLQPTREQLEHLADALLGQAKQRDGGYVAWTAELLHWRFFAPDGPRHVLINSNSTGAWAVLSYGVKSRINVARLIEYDSAGDSTFLRDVARVVRRLGAGLSLAYTSRPNVRDELMASGWRLRKDAPSSFTGGTERISISAAATDVGFEALTTERG